MTTTPVLLFAHGAGFCKEIWDPIIRRMKETSLLGLVDFVRVDLPFHGVNRDNSEIAQVDEHGPHVTHPANNAIALASNVLLTMAKEFSSAGRPVIGIGHSMGAAALWKAEVTDPGTFEGLVLFEPIYGPPTSKGPDRPYHFLADVTLKRAWKWDSREAAVKYFENWKSFSTWDRESLASWLQGAVVPDDNGGNGVVLACHPTVEASIYCGDRLWLSEQEQARPKCVTSLHSGSRTKLYRHEIFEGMAGRFPEIYKPHAPMVGNSHLMVLEDPEACAKAIVSDLDALKCFSAPSSRL